VNRIAILFCNLSIIAALERSYAEEKPAEALSVRIVPTNFRETVGRSITLWQPTQHFHVIITNSSDKPLRLWKEWCSWGYYNLYFEATDKDGKKSHVKKMPRGWTKNFPDWITVFPGDHKVFEVTFDATWRGAPVPPKGKSHKINLKAVFEIGEDKDTKQNQVWTGKVSSPELPYTIYR